MTRERSVSVLKESLPGERRVILLPAQVRQFKEKGFRVYVERGAGNGIGHEDCQYEAAGAEMISTEDAWYVSPYVIKYKAPTSEEYRYFHTDLHLGAWFHAEGNKALALAMCDSGMTAYSFEFFRTPDGIFPMSVASSEIAGKLAILYGAYHLQSHLGGSGVLLADVVGVKRPKVVVIGYGNAGGAAARLAVNLGAEVVVIGTNQARLRRFQATVSTSVRCYINSREVLARELQDADLVVGAVLISTYDTPPMIDESLVKQMKLGSMIVDITCGYGRGYLPTFDRLTTFDEPVYERYGVLHCKLNAMPASVSITTNQAVSSLVVPYLIRLGGAIFDESSIDPISSAGKIIENGQIVHPEVQRHMDMIAALGNRNEHRNRSEEGKNR